jgi:hypothetical protein
MATPPASFDWKQYYTSVAIDPATESQVDQMTLNTLNRKRYGEAIMAMTRDELESVTKQNFLDALHKVNLLGDATSDLIPTDYEGQKEYYKNRKKKYGRAKVPVPELAAQFISKDRGLLKAIAGKFDEALTPEQFAALPLKNFNEDALDENALPLQSLTKTYITMMENEGSDGDNWDRALQILYPDKEDK